MTQEALVAARSAFLSKMAAGARTDSKKFTDEELASRNLSPRHLEELPPETDAMGGRGLADKLTDMLGLTDSKAKAKSVDEINQADREGAMRRNVNTNESFNKGLNARHERVNAEEAGREAAGKNADQTASKARAESKKPEVAKKMMSKSETPAPEPVTGGRNKLGGTPSVEDIPREKPKVSIMPRGLAEDAAVDTLMKSDARKKMLAGPEYLSGEGMQGRMDKMNDTARAARKAKSAVDVARGKASLESTQAEAKKGVAGQLGGALKTHLRANNTVDDSGLGFGTRLPFMSVAEKDEPATPGKKNYNHPFKPLDFRIAAPIPQIARDMGLTDKKELVLRENEMGRNAKPITPAQVARGRDLPKKETQLANIRSMLSKYMVDNPTAMGAAGAGLGALAGGTTGALLGKKRRKTMATLGAVGGGLVGGAAGYAGSQYIQELLARQGAKLASQRAALPKV